MKVYYTMYNGMDTFKVYYQTGKDGIVTIKDVKILKTEKDNNLDENFGCVYQGPYEEIFIGKDTGNLYLTDGELNDDNIILIRISDNEYIFVGHLVCKFKALSPIVNFYSPLTFNAVPEAYAFDEQDNCYYFEDGGYIIKGFPNKNPTQWLDNGNKADYEYNELEMEFFEKPLIIPSKVGEFVSKCDFELDENDNWKEKEKRTFFN